MGEAKIFVFTYDSNGLQGSLCVWELGKSEQAAVITQHGIEIAQPYYNTLYVSLLVQNYAEVCCFQYPAKTTMSFSGTHAILSISSVLNVPYLLVSCSTFNSFLVTILHLISKLIWLTSLQSCCFVFYFYLLGGGTIYYHISAPK